jgi:deoxyadenosine/deoxycytidine kinase
MNIFAKEMMGSGLFSQPQVDVYSTMYNAYANMFPALNSKGIIYLRTSPETCYQRLVRRKRPE